MHVSYTFAEAELRINFNKTSHQKTTKFVFFYMLLNMPQVLIKLMNRWFKYHHSNKYFVWYTGTGVMNWFALGVMYKCKVSLNKS